MQQKLLLLFASGVLGVLAAVACGSSNGDAGDDVPTVADAGKKKDAATSPSSTGDGDGTDAGPGTDTDADTNGTKDAGVDAAIPWPTCNAKPPAVAAKTIPQLWADDNATATAAWVSGVYVTAMSGTHCAANVACQFFVQDAVTYPSIAAGAKHAIKVFVSAATATHFVTTRVGDKVDILAYAWRYDVDVQHELLLQVNEVLPGCALTTSTANVLTPISGAKLSDLTVAGYEDVNGPLFVKVDAVSGKPDVSPIATFGLFDTADAGSFDAGSTDIVSLSPFFLTGATFTGLSNTLTHFTSITGVFGLFVPAGGPKYLELYPREAADIVTQ